MTAEDELVDQLSELSHTLWRQRGLVEMLLYRLEVQQLVLAAGRTRWIDASAREVEDAITDIRSEELVRAAQVSGIAPAIGIDPGSSLGVIAAHVPEPWDHILREHQAAFLGMIASAESVSRDNVELLNRGLIDTRAFLAAVSPDSHDIDGYASSGRGLRRSATPTLVDWDV